MDDIRLIYKVCSLYYEDGLSQQEICDNMGISRATVSRLLKKGKENGIVKVEVLNPVQFSYGQIEKTLERKYGLKEVIIVDSNSLDTNAEYVSRLYERAALYLAQFFKDGDYIGVSMGYTIHNIAKVKQAFPKDNHYMFVPIVGGISQITVGHEDIQSNQVAKEFAKKFGGTYTQFLSPAVFSEKAVMKYFMKEKSVSFIFDYFRKLDTLVMGIGIPERAESTLIRAGYITEKEMDKYVEEGLVGDIALQFFDARGNTEQFKEFNDRVAGMPTEMIRKVRNRIGIAGGANRVEAIKGAIRGGFINMLITNVDSAEKLL
ncbi:MAG: sugar-binding transcriptional regulator [Lachnospiraceae bacterium]|nr:sugar-binding transcriptional regulator [Lachnospiraceae bacterium]